ncbi:MAG: hypothetical protein QXE90_02760 [Candidatus Micrarchaeia archaeon]
MNNNRIKIYCFGNPLIENDKMPLEIIPYLQKKFPMIEFIPAESPDEIEEENEISIIDTVDGVENVRLITEIDEICENRRCSMHDFDLGMTLKIMKKIGKIKKITIFAIPMKCKKRKAIKEIEKLIHETLAPSNP